MTGQTGSLITSFVEARSSHLIPSIIIGMQEEDDVSNRIQFKNCFKQLRNIAAHEPSTLTTQLMNESNKGCQTIVFKTTYTNLDKNTLTVDMVQFTAWMLDMYMITRDRNYLMFIKTLIRILYPAAFKKYQEKVQPVFSAEPLGKSKVDSWCLSQYLLWQKYMNIHYGDIRPISTIDPFIVNMFQDNKRVFWKMAVPNMMDLVLFIFGSNVNDVKSNITLYLEIFKARDC